MILIADLNEQKSSELAALAGSLGPSEVVGAADLLSTVANRRAEVDVVLLGPSVPTSLAVELAEGVQAAAPEVVVLMLSKDATTDLLRQAMHAGVRDVLSADEPHGELVNALSRAMSTVRAVRGNQPGSEAVAESSLGQVITVFSTKGGCGKSFVSTNLGILLAQELKGPVPLIDLDLQSGDLAIMLQVVPSLTIHDTVEHGIGLDIDALRGYLMPHRSGVQLLAAPPEPSLAETIPPDMIRRIIRLLRENYSKVLIDGPGSFTEHILAALDESDVCVLMASMDVPSIKNLNLSMQTLRDLGFPRERIRLVLNRADSKVGLRLAEVERSLGTTVDATIPSSRDVPLSVNQGRPLALEKRRSPVVNALVDLMNKLGDTPVGARVPAESKPLFTAKSSPKPISSPGASG